MKRYIIIIMLVISIIPISSCENLSSHTSKNSSMNTEDKLNQQKTTQSSQSNNIKTPINNSGSLNSDNSSNLQNNSSQRPWYGDWIITKKVASGKVSAYSDEQIKSFINKKIYYGSDKASFDVSVQSLPYYDIKTLSDSDFFNLSNVNVTDIGINSKSVVEVQIYSDKALKNFCNFTGGNFFIKDANTLIILDGGVYFEARKL